MSTADSPDKSPEQKGLEDRMRAQAAELAEANRLLKQEIGHRRKAEESNAKFAAIVEHSTDAIIAHKLDGTVVTWNAGAERIFKYTAEEMRGLSVAVLSPPERSDELSRLVQQIRLSEIVQHFETQRVRKDGAVIDVAVTVSPIKDAAGRIAGASQIIRDITRHKRLEQDIRDGEARARAILDTAVDGIITIDERGLIESMNNAAERLFGFTAAEIAGKNVKLLMPEPYSSEHDRYIDNYVRTGRARIIGIGREVVGKRKDGSVFPLDLAVSEVRLGNRRIFTGVVRDLTERRRLEQEILDVSDREKRRIGQDLHDSLGQLLAGIGFKSKALENKITAKGLPEATSARQIAELVTHAIVQARALARGLQPVESKSNGLMSALQEMSAGLENLFRVKCVFHCPEPVNMDDPAAATHLYRIAQEGANNAIKHGGATSIDISLRRENDLLLLQIQDNGSGIPASGPAGTGMGLQIMRYRASMLGGTLTIRSGENGGTIVQCSVPGIPAAAKE